MAAGVTGKEAVEAGPVPTEFVAVTVKVYGVPFVNPETAHDVLLELQPALTGEEATV